MTFPFISKHIDCTHFEKCSGCSINKFVENTPIYHEAKLFFEKKGLELPLHVGNVCGWRHRAKLAVRGSTENPQIGLFKANSHEVVAIPHCQVHHPRINEAVQMVEKFIISEKIIPYEEKTNLGELRYLQLAVESATGRVQLTFVCHHQSKKEKWEEALKKLWQAYPDFWHSLWLNYNTRSDNVIFGEEWELAFGEPFLWETLEGVNVCFHPASFAQANIEMFAKMVSAIKNKISQKAKVAEFYAGVGVIGLAISNKCEWVRCCEINPRAEECFEKAKEKLSSDISVKISFHSKSAASAVELLNDSDIIIVDPPRKGIDLPLLKAIQTNYSARQLIYVSCGWTAFQKDFKALSLAGWNLEQGDAYLFFPGSNHIEVLAVFVKT